MPGRRGPRLSPARRGRKADTSIPLSCSQIIRRRSSYDFLEPRLPCNKLFPLQRGKWGRWRGGGEASCKGCSVCFPGCKFFPSPPSPRHKADEAAPAGGSRTGQVEKLIQSTGIDTGNSSRLQPPRDGSCCLSFPTTGTWVLKRCCRGGDISPRSHKPPAKSPAPASRLSWRQGFGTNPSRKRQVPRESNGVCRASPRRQRPRKQHSLTGLLQLTHPDPQNPSEDPFRPTNPAWCWGTLDVAPSIGANPLRPPGPSQG